MPTVLKVEGFRFFFFSEEGKEPMHVHVESGERYAKFWIHPVRLAASLGFRAHELNALRKMVETNEKIFEEKWNGYFSGR